ncbi:MAG: hypothetical protein HY397_02420 [Candidatus Doudnabacteria bacterium]|nr:hypothetical protein [Candidatus Doudnabacteria bacterium]
MQGPKVVVLVPLEAQRSVAEKVALRARRPMSFWKDKAAPFAVAALFVFVVARLLDWTFEPFAPKRMEFQLYLLIFGGLAPLLFGIGYRLLQARQKVWYQCFVRGLGIGGVAMVFYPPAYIWIYALAVGFCFWGAFLVGHVVGGWLAFLRDCLVDPET